MENTEEIWNDVLGYEGLYQASDLGSVKSLDRMDYINGWNRIRKGKTILFFYIKGYRRLSLSKNNVPKKYFIHRLVWEAFNGKIPDGVQVNHKDGNKANNKLSNLELCTAKENIHHSINELGNCRRGEKHVRSKITQEQAQFIVDLRKQGKRPIEIIKITGLSRSYVNDISNGKRWPHLDRT